MQVLKIIAEGITTSFRYPHFIQGMHPSFEMPPPATIYGHICSALGEWVSPRDLMFAYRFTCSGKFDDVEHIHLVSSSTGKIQGTNFPKVLEGSINPFKRSILFQPRLELYINKPEWENAFRSPYYPVALGRSQDLFTYRNVNIIELEQSPTAYFENTLLPYKMVFQTGQGYAVLLPRFINYNEQRTPKFARYIILKKTVHSSEFLSFGVSDKEAAYWIDKTTSQ
jgi:CRISPR-associated protein Cas5t